MALSLVKNLAKVAFAGGALYVTVDQGVWGTSSQTTNTALATVKTSVLPATSDYIDKSPSIGSVNNSVMEKWNAGVQTAFGAVSNAPEFTKGKMLELKKSLTSS